MVVSDLIFAQNKAIVTQGLIYVNFDGVTVSNCANYCSDATTNRSWAIGAHFGTSAVAFPAYTGSGRQAIVDSIRRYCE